MGSTQSRVEHLAPDAERRLAELFLQFSEASHKDQLLLLKSIEKDLLHQSDGKGTTFLHLAVKCSDTHCVEYLLRQGADPSIQDISGSTAVHLAASAGSNDDCLLQFLGPGCENYINKQDVWGYSALHCAMIHRRWASVSQLVNTGCDVNLKDNDGRSALHVAASYGRLEQIRYLVDHGASVNCQDAHGRTPLYLALVGSGCQQKTAQLLHELGCDPNLSDHPDGNPLYLAMDRGNVDFVRLLLQLGAQCNEEMLRCALRQANDCESHRRQRYIGMVKIILAASPEVPSVQAYGLAFKLSYAHNVKEILPLLIAAGAALPETPIDRVIVDCPLLVDVCRRAIRRMCRESRVTGNVFSLVSQLNIPPRLKRIIALVDLAPEVADCFMF